MAMGVPEKGTPIAFFRARSLPPSRVFRRFPRLSDARRVLLFDTCRTRSLTPLLRFSDFFPAFLTRAVFYSLTLAARAL